MISDTTRTNGEMFGQLKLDKIKMELTDKITVDKNLTIKDGMKKIDECGFVINYFLTCFQHSEALLFEDLAKSRNQIVTKVS